MPTFTGLSFMAKTTTIPLFRTVLLLIALLCTSSHIQAQFYTGMHQPFGKNRVQHEDFYWTFYRFNNFNIYQTSGGEKLSEYTARHAPQIIANIERKIGYTSAQHINFIIYNKKNEFKQSNVGYDDPMKGTGGVTQIASSNVFLYFEGDYNDFHEQIEKGVADMLIHRMIFGDNWKEVIKNATLLYVPDWYTKGLISYIAQPWSTELDDRVKDGVMTNRFKKFNHLEEPDKTYAGHAIWAYVAEVYGPEMIPNVLYMTRVSRSIESGFLFVLGVGLKQLASDAWLHYRVKYELDEENMKFPEDKLLYSKTRKKRDYYQITMSEDGRYFAFASNRLGKHKAYLYDTEKKKKKKLYKGGQKMDRLTDLSVPVLDFREDNGVVAVFYEKKAEPHLIFYDIEEKKKYKREVFRVDKVLSAKFSPDGGKMIMSAMFQGQTDLWEYNLRGNTVKQLTNDMYDDLDPDYINENEIIFVSNRPNDTLEKTRGYLPDLMTKKDIYVLNTNSKSLQRITETPFINESSPAKYKDKQYVYLSDRNGIRNRWIARMDSAISHVDTVIHYRSITNTSPLTNYSRNIIEHSVTPDIDKATDLIFEDGKYRIYQFGIEELEDQSKHEMKETDYSLTKKKKRDKDKENPVELQKVEVAVRILKPDTTKLEEDPNRINIDDYTFQGEDRMSEQRRGSIGQFATIAGKGSESETDTIKKDEFSMPERRDYSLNFSYTDITSTMDFNFANSLYQPFNGGPYTNPGIGVLMKVDMLDLFQDYKIQGGFRYGFNNSNLEFFLSLFDRSRRLDRRYTLKRQSFRLNTPTSVQKVVIYKGEYGLSYPFSEALALRGELSYRNDRTTAASVDDQSLVEPDDFLSQGGLKLELVFDNTRKRGLNLYYGTRFKIFGETYLETNNLQSDLNVVGIDFRHYQKISRDFIYAGRLAASSSFGSRKVVYYLGSVDDWIILDPSKARFNRQTPISQQQNYQFQALASPMRGFIQNARNGNSFFVINNEFRFPIFRYFSTRPQKSDILENFQIVAFSDVGTAWNGTSPFSDENEFNTITVVDGPVTVKLDNKRYPIIGSAGAGLRTKLLGYFLKLDLAWGIDDGIVQQPITHISMGFDF
jgi:WD40 repeat protein